MLSEHGSPIFLLRDAYQERRAGHQAEADRLFRQAVDALLKAGEKAQPGNLPTPGTTVLARKVGGYSYGGKTLLFDATSFEPVAFFPDLVLPAGQAVLEGAWFLVQVHHDKRLYDPLQDRFSDVPPDLIQAHPDGRRVYVLGDGCLLQEWQIDPAKKLRTLAPYPNPEGGCDAHSFEDAAVTRSGALLVTRQGVWNLANNTRSPLPNRSPKDTYAPAIAGRGRYVLRVRTGAGAPEAWPQSQVDLYDLETGAVKTSAKISMISNSDPFQVRSDPERACVFDYGMTVLLIPSLQELDSDDPRIKRPNGSSGFGHTSCDDWFDPPAGPKDVAAKVAQNVCTLGGLPLPRKYCDGLSEVK